MIYKCVSCQHEHHERPGYWVPPSQCERCGAGVTAVRDTERPPAPARHGDFDPKVVFEDRKIADAENDGARPRVFVSTLLYGLSRQLGPADAVAELHRQIKELSTDPGATVLRDEALPVASLLARLSDLYEVSLLVDGGGSNLAKARSRHAHAFLKSGLDTWISVDDDVDAASLTLEAMVEAVGEGAPSVCVAPCLMRQPAPVNVAFEPVVVDRILPSGSKLRSCLFGGFGLVALSREAVQRAAAAARKFVDDDGERKAVLFQNLLLERSDGDVDWYIDDVSFFQSLPAGVRVEALLSGYTKHAGELLDLSKVPEMLLMQAPATFTRRRAEATEHKFVKYELGEPHMKTLAGGELVPVVTPGQAALLEQHSAALKSEQAAAAVALAADKPQDATEEQKAPDPAPQL